MSRGSVHNQEGGQSEVGYIKPIKEGIGLLPFAAWRTACNFVFLMDAAFTLALRLRSISTQIYGWKPDTHSLPLESRVAQIEHAVGEAVVPHVSLQRLLNQSMYTNYSSN